jgi:hypothetical protein
MGDLRNKIKREIDAERMCAQMAQTAARPKQPPPRCDCGNTWHDVRPMWCYSPDRWKPSIIYCPGCLPFELFSIVMMDVANMPVVECDDVQLLQHDQEQGRDPGTGEGDG